MLKELQINFLALENSVFNFALYAKSYTSFEKNENIYFTKNADGIFGISRDEVVGFNLKTFNSKDNVDLAKWYLLKLLNDNCHRNKIEYRVSEKFNKYIDIIISKDNLGEDIVTISPGYINQKLGFILNCRFKKNKETPFTVEIQKRSLSLDSQGNENKNFYIDKYNKITGFIKNYYNRLFDFQNVIKVSKDFEFIGCNTLETKKYIFANEKEDYSQFQGIKKYGPYGPIDISNNAVICFIYRNNEKNYSYKLYYALEGKLYSTFAGMEAMFKFPLNKSTVIGVGVEDYKKETIDELLNEIKTKAGNRNVVPILLVPWSKENASEEQRELYYNLKYHFLINNIASQFISIKKVINDNILKWSISSLAIQVFSKLGGSPWKVVPKTDNCLIIGIGQSYKYNDDNSIKKYFSYSILTDSSGLFKEIKILADSDNEEQYIQSFSDKLLKIISSYSTEYKNFVIHTTFRIKKRDMNAIHETINSFRDDDSLVFAVLRFDDSHDYLCFDTNVNSLVPLESTKVRLSYKNFLIWFEGQQYGNSIIRHRIGAPIRINVDYPDTINDTLLENYLQDSINLSGANWRGFNAKSVPVSLLYAELISGFLASFEKYNLQTINIENMKPWFL